MNAVDYMAKQMKKHRRNYERERARGVPDDMLRNIKRKISYYEAALIALKGCVVDEWVCERCTHYPPSSTDGKPCSFCDPNNPMTNCFQERMDK